MTTVHEKILRLLRTSQDPVIRRLYHILKYIKKEVSNLFDILCIAILLPVRFFVPILNYLISIKYAKAGKDSLITAQFGKKPLDDVLVLTVKKSFWASPECQIFPNRIYTKIYYGHSQNLINSLFVTLKGLAYFFACRPKLILFGSACRVVPWFIRFKRAGLLPDTKLVATNQINFNDAQAKYLDKVIVYSRKEIEHHDLRVRSKYEFIPLPADGDFYSYRSSQNGGYIFSGGGAFRDFKSLIEAVKLVDVRLKIVTFSPKCLNYSGTLPPNCEVYYRIPLQDYLKTMAGSLFVVVPLQEAWWPHGHVTVVQALSLGKAIVTTKNASVDDYVTDGLGGILVSPGNVIEYREAIMKLINNPDFRISCEQYANAKAQELTYKEFAKRINKLTCSLLVS